MQELLGKQHIHMRHETGVFDIVKKYISLIQSDGATAHDIAITIGKDLPLFGVKGLE